MLEPRVRDGLRLVEQGGDPVAGNDLEATALALHPPAGVAELRTVASLERELLEGDPRLLPELAQRQPEVDVDGEIHRGDLVEGSAPAVLVRELHETPGELAPRVRRADRVAHRDPASPFDAVHQEGRSALLEEQALVAEQREVGRGARRLGDDATGALDLLRSRQLGPWRAGRSSRTRENAASSRLAPSTARSERGACSSRANCHHSSFEYST